MNVDPLLSDLIKLREKSRQNTASLLRIIDSTIDALEGGASGRRAGSSDPGAPGVAGPAGSEEAAQSRESVTSRLASLRVMNKLADQHKSYHATLSKFFKTVDRTFTDGPPDISRSVSLNRKAMDELVALHLYTERRFRTAARVVEEAGLPLSLISAYESLVAIHEVDSQSKVVKRFTQVMEAMERRDLAPAYQWVEAHRQGLSRLGSNLEFQLVRLQYLLLLLNAPGSGAALQLAQERFADFAHANMEEVQSLMGCLLYAERLDRSPYSALLSEDLWHEAVRTLYVDGCRLLGLPTEGALSVLYRAALLALTPLQKMKAVVEGSKGCWDGIHELPAEVDLGPSLHFHSIFSCPVTREQASRDNPPMLLKCGHVICKNSMTRILRGGHRLLKCPTCPMEQYADETRELKL